MIYYVLGILPSNSKRYLLDPCCSSGRCVVQSGWGPKGGGWKMFLVRITQQHNQLSRNSELSSFRVLEP